MSTARPDAPPAVNPIEVSAELKALMRRLKLGQHRHRPAAGELLDTVNGAEPRSWRRGYEPIRFAPPEWHRNCPVTQSTHRRPRPALLQ